MQWFRMYAEFATDPKVQSLSETFQRRFTMFLCLQCNGEYERLTDDEIAFALRITPAELGETKAVFKQKGFLDDNGKIRNWNKRQYKSDDSTERVRKHRERLRNDDETLQKRSQRQIQKQIQKQKEGSDRAASQPRERDEPEGFAEIRQAYPKRAGSHRWPQALKHFNARLREGHSAAEILEGVKRYAAYCANTQRLGTETVQQAATFMGPNKGFTEPWIAAPVRRELSAVERVAMANGVRRDERVVAEQNGSSFRDLDDLGSDVRQPSSTGLRRISS